MDTVDNDYIQVPADTACQGIGFSFDAGGSDTKVLYRSKKDYHNSKLMNTKIDEGKGLLRMAHFLPKEADKLTSFLEKECDIDHTIKDKTAHITGAQSEWLEEQIKDRLGISLHRIFEFDSMISGLRFLQGRQHLAEFIHPGDEEGVAEGNEMLKFCIDWKDNIDRHTKGTFFAEQIDGSNQPRDEDVNNISISPPFLLSQLGSALCIHKVSSDWSYNAVEFSHFGAKACWGIANVICGEIKSYDELMKLAASGDSSQVDIHDGDLFMTRRHGELYTTDGLYFMFGKAASQSTDCFNKADMLSSWVNIMCSHFASHTHLTALFHGVDLVLMTGGFQNHPLVRKQITKHWHARVLQAKGKKIELHFVKNGQFLGALGAYLQNVKALGK